MKSDIVWSGSEGETERIYAKEWGKEEYWDL